jgi:mono/diheme cytochrome c family protein
VVRGAVEPVESASFKEFNPAFVSLVGRETELSAADMQSFTDFAMALTMPPNPVRALDNSLTADQQAGSTLFNGTPTTLLGNCNACHTLQPASGRFGTGGLMSFEGGRVTDNFKVPQLRNVYQKAGMFGFSAGSGTATGAQIRGFGFANDGSVDTLDTFFSDPVFTFPAPADRSRAQAIEFVLAMDSDLLPVVGQQVSWRSGSSAAVEARLGVLKSQALVTAPRAACSLVVRASIDGTALSGLFQSDGTWLMRDGSRLTDAQLRALARAAEPLTFTCVPPAAGRRVALNLN